MATTRLIRGSIQGIVYLVDPTNGHVYTFNPAKPTFVGTIEKCTDKHMISKSDGALSGFKVSFRHDIKEVMERLVKEKSETTIVAKGGAGV
jgi:hypothetical protein